MTLLDVQRELFAGYMLSQDWTRQQMRDHQLRRLERLIQHAKEQVPFYRDRLDILSRRDGEIDWDRWTDVPILTRRDVFENGDALLAHQVPPGHGGTMTFKTTGSTGMQVALTHTELSARANQAATFRGHIWHKLDWSGNLLEVVSTNPELETLTSPQPDAVWGPQWMPTSTGRRFSLNRHVRPADLLEFIQSKRIKYLVTRPIEAHALALGALASGQTVSLDAVIGVGTGVRPDERADCEMAFGCPFINPYGAKEGGLMAFPCPETGHFHVSEENVLLEIVDDDGRPCPLGQMGRVIVTPLYEWAQPLIRYDQGDVAVMGSVCSCGRSLKVLAKLVGRQEELFQFAGGPKFAMAVRYELMEEFGVRSWQIAQTGPLAVELRYVPLGKLLTDKIVKAIKTSAGRDDIDVSFRPVEEVARRPGGKHLYYVNETLLRRSVETS